MKASINYFIKNNFQYYAFIIVAFSIAFTKEYLPYSMALWVITGVLSIRRIKKENFQHLILLIFPLGFYVFHIIGLFYSSDLFNGLFDLEVKLSILLLPFVTLFITKKTRIKTTKILKVFVLANFIMSIICLILALQNSIQVSDSGRLLLEPSVWKVTKDLSFLQLILGRHSWFSYSFLSFIHHPSYFSIYILFSIIILGYFIKTIKDNVIWNYILILYFTFFLWLLGSRAAYISYFVCLLSILIFIVFKKRKYWIGLIVLVSGLVVSVLMLSNKKLSRNLYEAVAVIESKSLNEDSDIRLWLWKSGYEVFKDHFWFGVGTGDADEKMNEKYRAYDLVLAKEHNYNSHNQYVDVAVKLGIIGFVILIGWLIIALYITLHKKQFLFFYFILIISINLFFEAFLNSIAGIAFFAFFYSLLYSIYNIETKKEIV